MTPQMVVIMFMFMIKRMRFFIFSLENMTGVSMWKELNLNSLILLTLFSTVCYHMT